MPSELALPASSLPWTYLDKNALSDLAWRRSDLHATRNLLCAPSTPRMIALGQWVFAEMSCVGSRDQLDRELRFVNALFSPRILQSSGAMMQREITCFMIGARPNPFISAKLPIDFEDPEWEPVWVEEKRLLSEANAEFLRDEDERQLIIEKYYPNAIDRRRKLRADWNEDRSGTLERFVRDKMRTNRLELYLHHDESGWPRPQDVPTLWCHWAYRITRTIAREIGIDGRTYPPRRSSDFADLCHFQSAAHVDEFVTSDEWFLALAAECPAPKPKFLMLDDWVQQLAA